MENDTHTKALLLVAGHANGLWWPHHKRKLTRELFDRISELVQMEWSGGEYSAFILHPYLSWRDNLWLIDARRRYQAGELGEQGFKNEWVTRDVTRVLAEAVDGVMAEWKTINLQAMYGDE